jgi:hypothetical protein
MRLGVLARTMAGLVCAMVSALLLPGPGSGQDACATPRLLTPVGTPLPRTGFGLVVSDAREQGLVAALVRGRRRTPLVAAPLGPGLFRLAEAVGPGTYRLEGVSAASEVVVSARAARPAPAVAPSLRAARRVSSTAMGSGQTRSEILLDLAFPVPQGVIVARAHWNGADDVAVWTTVAAGQASLTIPLQPSCALPGWQPPPDGELSMRVSFVDLLGQPSPLSAPITVE